MIMRKTVFIILCSALSFNAFSQPLAPDGQKWVLVEELSDEFNQDGRDTDK
jgi:hypothetical protein